MYIVNDDSNNMVDKILRIRYKRMIGNKENEDIYLIYIDNKLNDEFFETTLDNTMYHFLKHLKIRYNRFRKVDSRVIGDYYEDEYWVYI